MSLGLEFADVGFRIVFDLGFAFAAADADLEVGSLLLVCVFADHCAFAFFRLGDFFGEGNRIGVKFALALSTAESDGDFDDEKRRGALTKASMLINIQKARNDVRRHPKRSFGRGAIISWCRRVCAN